MESIEFSENSLSRLLKEVGKYMGKNKIYAQDISFHHQLDGDYWICFLYFLQK